MAPGIRLTGGRFASSMIAAPIGSSRPSSARARKSLFDMLAHRIGVDFAASVVLDIFAGAGTLGFEALSRDSPYVIFVENQQAALRQIAKNADRLGMADFCFPLRRHALRPGRRPKRFPPAQLVFADPPYRSDLACDSIVAFHHGSWFAENAIIVLEDAAAHPTKIPEGFMRTAHHRAGAAQFDILSAAAK